MATDLRGPPPPAEKKDLDYAKEFWTVGNVVTGFAILQGITFLINVGPQKGDLFCAVTRHVAFSQNSVLYGTAIYLLAVIFCHGVQYLLLTARHALGCLLIICFPLWTIGELVIIAALGLISYGAVSAPLPKEILTICPIDTKLPSPSAAHGPVH